MSLKTAVASRFMAWLTGEERLRRARARVERKRRSSGAAHRIDYFHQVDDPYAHLAVQALLALRERYQVEIVPHLVGPPADWAAPERELLKAYARLDAVRLADKAGLHFVDPGRQPAASRLQAASAALAARLGAADFFDAATEIGGALWADGDIPAESADVAAAIAAGEARRQALGHFMSAMIYYGGEWYWGVDRLHYLEARLVELGARKPAAPARPVYLEPSVPAVGTGARANQGSLATTATLHFYLSFRSPYTYLATERVKALADAYGADLQLRFVLPMVMRGLPVPRMKGIYFAQDAAREGRRLGVPFGRIADPVGTPVERGYSLLPWARDQGRGYEYCRAFLRAVWSEGVDAGSDAGLRRIVTAAGLDWRAAAPLVGNDAWRAEAEANRAEMLALGLWGVPCLRVDDLAVWGQDRLWVIEDQLQRLALDDAAEGTDERP
ncbi:MAG: DsbA family protein [Pseudomonadales bacterium]